ncbi:MAG: TIGR01620 family protein [Pseudomonadota bacterium]
MAETQNGPDTAQANRTGGAFVLELDAAETADKPGAAGAPPIEDGPAQAPTPRAPAVRGGGLALQLFVLALGGLGLLAGALAVEALVTAAFVQTAALGWVGVALAALLAGAFVALCLGEIAGLARLGRLDRLRQAARRGAVGDGAAAHEALAGLKRLLQHRADAADGLARLAAAEDDAPDPAERLALAEKLVVAPLDAAAEREVERAARAVAGATALIPIALLDIALVLFANLRMIRRVAGIYGGRGGWLGAWRLLKAVGQHLVATGAMAATDDLLDPVLGQGVLGRLSRRLGEAAVNAALTARVGAAAIAVCRPLPYAEGEAPRARPLLMGAIGNWRDGTG